MTNDSGPTYPELWDSEFGGKNVYQAAVSIFRAEREIHRVISAVLSEFELTVPQWTIMTIVYFSNQREMTIGKVADKLGVHSSTVTLSIDKLEKSGWMGRRPADGRTVLARVTDAGAAGLRQVQARLVAANFGIGDLGDEGFQEIDSVLRRVGSAVIKVDARVSD